MAVNFELSNLKRIFKTPGLNSRSGSISFSSFKDFDSHKFTVEKSREPIQKGFFATHKFNFVNKHLDNKPIESRSKLKVENKPEKFRTISLIYSPN